MTDIKKLLYTLEELYPQAPCGLDTKGDPFRILVMAILSAQTTDRQVNKISEELFKRFPNPLAMAQSGEGELEEAIRSVGFFNAKAKNLRSCCARLCSHYKGEIPSEMEDLLSLAGVGRKVANLIRGDLFGLGGIVADTHVIRISNRLGFAKSLDPLVVEQSLDPLIPKDLQSDFCHRMVFFGREVCKAKKPLCHICKLTDICIFKT